MALFWSKNSDYYKTAFQWTMEKHRIECAAIINADYMGGEPHKTQTCIRYFQQSPNYSYSFYFCTFHQSVILGKPGWLFYKHNLDHVRSLLKWFQWLSNVFKTKSTFLTMVPKTLHDTTSYLSSFDQPLHPNSIWTTPALSVVPACQIRPIFALVIPSASCVLAHFSSSLKPQFKCLILRNLSWSSYLKSVFQNQFLLHITFTALIDYCIQLMYIFAPSPITTL